MNVCTMNDEYLQDEMMNIYTMNDVGFMIYNLTPPHA